MARNFKSADKLDFLTPFKETSNKYRDLAMKGTGIGLIAGAVIGLLGGLIYAQSTINDLPTDQSLSTEFAKVSVVEIGKSHYAAIVTDKNAQIFRGSDSAEELAYVDIANTAKAIAQNVVSENLTKRDSFGDKVNEVEGVDNVSVLFDIDDGKPGRKFHLASDTAPFQSSESVQSTKAIWNEAIQRIESKEYGFKNDTVLPAAVSGKRFDAGFKFFSRSLGLGLTLPWLLLTIAAAGNALREAPKRRRQGPQNGL